MSEIGCSELDFGGSRFFSNFEVVVTSVDLDSKDDGLYGTGCENDDDEDVEFEDEGVVTVEQEEEAAVTGTLGVYSGF